MEPLTSHYVACATHPKGYLRYLPPSFFSPLIDSSTVCTLSATIV